MEGKNLHKLNRELSNLESEIPAKGKGNAKYSTDSCLHKLREIKVIIDKLNSDVNMVIDDIDYWISESKFDLGDSEDYNFKLSNLVKRVNGSIWHEISDHDKVLGTDRHNP